MWHRTIDWRPASVIALVLALAIAGPTAAAEPARFRDAAHSGAGGGPASAAARAAAPRPFTLLLHRADDFVAQTNLVQCVGASMQMMLNIGATGADQSARTQLRLQRLARSLSGPRPDGRQRRGASVRGWAAGLNELGAGPYVVVGADSLEGALKIAARAMRVTGRPAGLLVWSGRHAWVMTGFRTTADPAWTADYRVTAVSIMDPLYPRTTRAWGRSPRPGAFLSVAEVGRQFVRRRTTKHGAVWMGGSAMARFNGKYVIVMPIDVKPPLVPGKVAAA